MMDNKDWLARVAEDMAAHKEAAKELSAVEKSDLVWMVQQLDSIPSTLDVLDSRTVYKTVSYLWYMQYCTKKGVKDNGQYGIHT